MSHDRDPADVFDDSRHPTPPELIDELAATQILTQRQAEAYVLREIEATPREAVAEELGLSTSGLDNAVQRAKRNLRDAAWVDELVEYYKRPPMPAECDECGDSLGGRWIETESAETLCVECADVDSGLPNQ